MAAAPTSHEAHLDSISWKILELLQDDARISFAELGRKVGLSTPAVSERVRRLEESGVITGYHATIEPAKIGLPIAISIRLTVAGGEVQMNRTIAAVKKSPEVIRCHRVTGAESFLIEALVVSVRHLEALIDSLSTLGVTSTVTLLSSPVKRRKLRAVEMESFRRYQ